MEKERFRLKHPELWIIAFVLMVAVAATAFAFSCSNMNKSEPGFYEITATSDKDLPYYASDYSFYYYFNKDDNITEKKKLITDVYSSKMKDTFIILNEDSTYLGYVAMASINAKPNEEVEVPEHLYNVIKDAYDKTTASINYSIFAAPLYAFWNRQIYLNKDVRVASDPLNSEESRNYLANTANYINDRNHVDLEFLEGKIKLKVSDAYLTYRQNQGIEAPYISLNILKTAYFMNEICAELEKNGYTAGMIISNMGEVYQGKDCPVQTYSLFSVNNLEIEYFGNINPTSNPTCCSAFRRFDINQSGLTNYYYFTQDNVTYFRSLYIDIKTGLQYNYFLSSGIYFDGNDCLTSALINNELASLNSMEDVKNYLSNESLSAYKVAFTIVSEPKNLYISNSMKEIVKLNADLDYNLYNLF